MVVTPVAAAVILAMPCVFGGLVIAGFATMGGNAFTPYCSPPSAPPGPAAVNFARPGFAVLGSGALVRAYDALLNALTASSVARCCTSAR